MKERMALINSRNTWDRYSVGWLGDYLPRHHMSSPLVIRVVSILLLFLGLILL